MTDRPRIMIGSADVTEHVAAMYDAIVGSLDWGSSFLDVETVECILIVGLLAGFGDTSGGIGFNPDVLPGYVQLEESSETVTKKIHVQHAQQATVTETINERVRHPEVLDAWRRQVAAKARALRGDE